MEFELEQIEQAILKQFNLNKINYNNIVSCMDKGRLLNIIDTINAVAKEFSICFTLDKFLINKYLLLSCNNIKLIITSFYLQLIIQD